jgi:hypothetical protein
MVMPHLPLAGMLQTNPHNYGKVPAGWPTMKEKVHHLVARRRQDGGDLALWLTKSIEF